MNPWTTDSYNNVVPIPESTGPSTASEGELFGLITLTGRTYQLTSDGTVLFSGLKAGCISYCEDQGLTPIDTTIVVD